MSRAPSRTTGRVRTDRGEREGTRLEVYVQPRASRDAVVGTHDGAWKVALTAPPVDGEANAALVSFVADVLGCASRDVTLVGGATSRRKTLEVRGLTRAEIDARLDQSRASR